MRVSWREARAGTHSAVGLAANIPGGGGLGRSWSAGEWCSIFVGEGREGGKVSGLGGRTGAWGGALLAGCNDSSLRGPPPLWSSACQARAVGEGGAGGGDSGLRGGTGAWGGAVLAGWSGSSLCRPAPWRSPACQARASGEDGTGGGGLGLGACGGAPVVGGVRLEVRDSAGLEVVRLSDQLAVRS